MHSILRSTRSMLPPLLGVALSLAFAACGDTESPLAPAGEDAALATVGESTAQIANPGGSRIIFNSARLGGYDIFKMDQYGGSLVGLTKSAYAGEPAWSRNNTQIAMVRERFDANNKGHTDIWITNADGTNGHWARSSPFPYNLRYPTWSPDGSRILLTIEQLGKPYLATLTLATGQVKFVTIGGSGVQANYPTYDPTGKKILFVAANGASLQLINLDGTGRVKVASFGKIMACPKFSRRRRADRLPDAGRPQRRHLRVEHRPAQEHPPHHGSGLRRAADLVAGRIEDRVHEHADRCGADLHHECRRRGARRGSPRRIRRRRIRRGRSRGRRGRRRRRG